MKERIKKNRPASGFTLIELMIVIAIIVILATIVMPKMRGAHDSGRLAACKMNLKSIGVAMEMYCQDNNNNYAPPAQMGGWLRISQADGNYLMTTGYIKNDPICRHIGYASYYINTANLYYDRPWAYCATEYTVGLPHRRSSGATLQQDRPVYIPGFGIKERYDGAAPPYWYDR